MMLLNKDDSATRALKYWIPVFYLAAFFLLPIHAFAGAKERKIDSLKKEVASRTDTARLTVLLKLTQAYYSVNKDSALFYGRLLKRESELSGNAERMCDAYVVLGSCFHHVHQEDSAMSYKRRALELAQAVRYPKGEANAASDIGLYLKERGDLDSAIFYILWSVELREKHNMEKALGVSYTNLGMVYYFHGDTTTAMLYYKKAEEIAAKYNDNRVRTVALNNIATVYDEMRKYDSALMYYERVYALCDSLEDHTGRSRAMLNMGVTYRNQKKYEMAEAFFLDALKIKETIGDQDGEAQACIELGENYRLLAQYDQSEKYLFRADTMAQRLGRKEMQRDVYKVFADLYGQTGRFSQALSYYKRYHELNEEILGEEKQKVIEELRTRFDTERKERENEQLIGQQRLNEAAIEEGKHQARLLVIGLIISLAIIALAVYAYRVKMKSSRLLEEKNSQISRQNNTLKELNKKLIESEDELTALNATKDQLFSLISHDLGNPVNAIVNYNTALRNQKETMTKEELAQSIDKVNVTLQPLQGFLDNLLHWSIQQRNGIVVRKENVNVNEVVEEITAIYRASLLTKRITVHSDVPSALSFVTDKNILRLMLRNIVGNAIKFSPEGEVVRITAHVSGSHLNVEVRNFGKRMEPEQIRMVLEGKRVNAQRGSLEEQGTGLGLSLVVLYLNALDGKLEIESEEETVVRILV